ncbi:serine hydrolase domain-containing protein [Kitasatospora sp. GP82]|uniref:serine hydrolase domain-containing protein n=1 Tax=Kitasatospora sp. GP82 TaxID=3035089 RepID=UPI0024742A89|nr:serine hydrolase domain-containing protein [Kitasatospora sp. GP82]MDH6129570.1 CubicO group peptidase (beta-lactamase class C family) [Kitasatospora sp. GP82]
MFRSPTCVISSASAGSVSGGHAVDRYAEIGSFTKVLTGTALMRMAAAGVLAPDDPLERWLPQAPGTGITLRQLAEHTSGLPRLPPGLGLRDPYAAFDRDALTVLLGRLGRLTVRAPGAAKEYSNFGYAVLGAALEAAAGVPYEELLGTYVLAPLAVAEVAVHPSAGQRLCARGLFGRERAPWSMDGAILPAGGLWATPRAVAALVTGLLVERRLGEPAPSWQRTGELHWHNGATRDSSVFTGAMPDGRWVVIHRLRSSAARTDREGVRILLRTEPPTAASEPPPCGPSDAP